MAPLEDTIDTSYLPVTTCFLNAQNIFSESKNAFLFNNKYLCMFQMIELEKTWIL